jgi:hypothetical protein
MVFLVRLDFVGGPSMRACLGGLAIVIALLALPLLRAQDDPKDVKKPADAKPAVKADKDDADAKKDEKKDDKKADKKTDKKKDDEKADKKEKLTWGAVFMGKLKEIDANSQKDFTVEVQIPVPNPQGQQALLDAQNRWQRDQLDISRDPNPRNRYNRMVNLQNTIARDLPRLQANTMKMQAKDLPVRAAEGIRVRALVPPLDYDDKGNIKKYTKEQLKEMKGPENLPGYTAEYESLRAGQMVQVYLAKQKGAAPPAKAKDDKAKDDKAKDAKPAIKLDDDLAPQRPEVVMIVIMAEPKDR